MPPTASSSLVINGWETVRYELLNTRICDLRLKIRGSPLEPLVRQLYRELAAKGLQFKPSVYLTDTWGCPNEVPVMGIPFYLADRRLARIEEEQTGDIENNADIMMFLRHEAGHAFNYAYRLWESLAWGEVFGPFSMPYRDTYRPQPFSRHYVRHLVLAQHQHMYAQKHPDEDFAETFALWLTPRSGWRRKYRKWPAIRKLEFVDRTMRRIRRKPPICSSGRLVNPVEEITLKVAENYGQRAERYRAAAQGYVDDRLREVFPRVRGRRALKARDLLHEHRDEFLARVARSCGLEAEDVNLIASKLESRAAALALEYAPRQQHAKLMDLVALTTALAVEFRFTGRFVD